jgi:hypothetical protein
MLLTDLSLARNRSLAILTAVGFLVFAWLYTARLTRSFARQRPRLAAKPAILTQRCAAGWRSGSPGHRTGAGRGARSQGLWTCPRPVSAGQRRRSTAMAHVPAAAPGLAAVAVIAITPSPTRWCHP